MHHPDGWCLMARSYANFTTAIWRDDDFRALTMAEQHCFMMLNTQADISAAGVLTMALTRWASRVAGCTQADVREAIAGLEHKGFVVVDEQTEEVLVRSFVKWDKGYNNYKRQPSIHDAADAIESPKLRSALAQEFGRIGAPKECVPESYSQIAGLSGSHADSPSDRHRDSHTDSPRVVVTEGVSTTEPPTRIPQSPTRVPAASGGGAREHARRRGTRLPEDFAITDDMKTWFTEKCPGVDGRRETEKFRNYWRAKSGKDATKVDWPATWRNWMLTAVERAGPRPGSAFTGATRHTAQRHDNPFAEQS
jgi:hypothetical protein